MHTINACLKFVEVAPREGRVSRNLEVPYKTINYRVAPREGRVSRNHWLAPGAKGLNVAPREGRVSRNLNHDLIQSFALCRAPRGACE